MMKIVSNCTAIAAALSAAYRTYDNDFQPNNHSSSSLEAFLDRNGILLSMCMRYHGFIPWLECSRKPGDTKLSASWIQVNKTRGGFRVIGKPVDQGPPVGLVLKPSSTKVRCLYPADAGTDIRDNNGCGPTIHDPRYGSQGYDHLGWFGKMQARAEIIYYKNIIFGKNRTWQSIPCSDYYMPPLNSSSDDPSRPFPFRIMGTTLQEHNATAAGTSSNHWKYWSEAQYYIDLHSYVMGHPVCNTSQPAPGPDFDDFNPSKETMWLLYMGPDVWYREQWSLVVELMEQTLDVHPLMQTWNELVLQVPADEADFIQQSVQAVFYIQGNGLVTDETARITATREAKRMIKPLLYVNRPGGSAPPADDDDDELFHCHNNNNDQDENTNKPSRRFSQLR